MCVRASAYRATVWILSCSCVFQDKVLRADLTDRHIVDGSRLQTVIVIWKHHEARRLRPTADLISAEQKKKRLYMELKWYSCFIQTAASLWKSFVVHGSWKYWVCGLTELRACTIWLFEAALMHNSALSHMLMLACQPAHKDNTNMLTFSS